MSAQVRVAAIATCALAVLAGCGGSGARPRPTARRALPALGSLRSGGAGRQFYEIYDPTGPARGTMLMIHGGGWKAHPGDARRYMTVAALAFRALGWRVINVGYASGQRPAGSRLDPLPMLRDVVAFYDQVHRAYGGPICAYGESAGGHLAAMLALERPTLRCAILNAAPLDLPTLLRDAEPAARADVRLTFGTGRSVLDEWSPARQWRTRVDHTAVFATAASNDPVVPPQQLRAFAAADPRADVAVLGGAPAGSADAVPWMHSAVNRASIFARLASMYRWLDAIAPRPASPRAPRADDVGAACGRLPPAGGRFRLLLAGDAWREAATPGQPIAATRGCSGSARSQEDGLSLWALPSPTAVLPAGAQASLMLDGGRILHRISVSFRGFLARPQDWDLGLYASRGVSGALRTQVARCDAGACSGLRLAATSVGGVLAPAGSRGDPDASNTPQRASFRLPSGTHRIAWELRCVAPGGCPVAAVAGPSGASLRPRDPLGQPAIFSLYGVELR